MNILRALFMIAVACGAISVAPAVAPPNILFIMTDDHAVRSISAYGSLVNHTEYGSADQRRDAFRPLFWS